MTRYFFAFTIGLFPAMILIAIMVACGVTSGAAYAFPGVVGIITMDAFLEAYKGKKKRKPRE